MNTIVQNKKGTGISFFFDSSIYLNVKSLNIKFGRDVIED